jgi:hypothetical protein
MDSSGVISTWGLSRPGIDLLATYLDKHRVSSVDLFNTIPSDCDLSRRIGDRDSFTDWIIPNLPNRIDNIPYEDDDED